jgi:hypothetical protein
MKISRRILIILIACATAALVCAGGGSDGRKVQITGRVRLVGSSPLNSLVITGEDREWFIEREEQQKLWKLQQQVVTVQGREYYRDLTFANGTPAGRQYFLKDIKVISPKPN